MDYLINYGEQPYLYRRISLRAKKRLGKAESIRFASIAIGSAAEVETQLIIVQELYGLDTSPQQQQVCEVERLLSGLIRSLR